MNKKITYADDFDSLSKNAMLTIHVCLEVLRDYHNDEHSLLDTIKYLIVYEGSSYEMFGILLGRENESDYDEFFEKNYIRKMNTNEIIIFYYADSYVVIPEKLGVKIITDWCAKNTTNPEIPTLCKQLKQKYEVE
ncbi:hypothetical protein [Wohlfahrtiimonas populi]|uniref:hypothetical protein n=1 Tax=Wohlfahrtiimonas populi TaxID=1940240 RepID=UPI00098D55A7|nr:hypothetical protein [Wohlfahrtiimonas populi]